VGGVSEEPKRDTRTRESNLPSPPRGSLRNGGRHPDSPNVVSLRGLAEERESRSVRAVGKGLVPHRLAHRRQRVSSGRTRRGTSSACAKRTHSSRIAPNKRHHERGRVLRSVQRPVHVFMRAERSACGESKIAVGQTRESGRNRPRDSNRRRTKIARLAAQDCRKTAHCVRKGRWSWPSSLRGNESPALSARTTCFVAEVGRQHPGLE
jgi:hypothetical protein